MRYWQPENKDKPKIPDKIATVEEFKKSLMVPEEEANEIERKVFGENFHHMSQTPPDKLVLRLLYPRDMSTPAIVWGIEHEKVAFDAYIKYQHENGHEILPSALMGFWYVNIILSLDVHLMAVFMTF